MWTESLIESKPKSGIGRSAFPISLAFLGHSIAIVFIVAGSYWYVEGVQPHSAIKYWSEIPIQFTTTPPLGEKMGMNSTQKPDHGLEKVSSRDIDVEKAVLTQQDLINPVELDPESNPPLNGVENIGTGSNGSGVPGGDPFGQTNGGPGYGLGDLERAKRLEPGMLQPVLIKKVNPVYPPQALKLHLQGRVILEATITKTGKVEDVRVLQSTNQIFEEPSVFAVKQWKYQPAKFNGRPIKVYFTITVKYTLRP